MFSRARAGTWVQGVRGGVAQYLVHRRQRAGLLLARPGAHMPIRPFLAGQAFEPRHRGNVGRARNRVWEIGVDVNRRSGYPARRLKDH